MNFICLIVNVFWEEIFTNSIIILVSLQTLFLKDLRIGIFMSQIQLILTVCPYVAALQNPLMKRVWNSCYLATSRIYLELLLRNILMDSYKKWTICLKITFLQVQVWYIQWVETSFYLKLSTHFSILMIRETNESSIYTVRMGLESHILLNKQLDMRLNVELLIKG